MTPDALRQALEALPADATLTLKVAELREALHANGNTPEPAAPAPGATWRERLWTCPAETRLGAHEVAEALGRPRSWVYRAVSAWTYPKKGQKIRRPHPLPAQRLDGELVFTAAAVRNWIARTSTPTP